MGVHENANKRSDKLMYICISRNFFIRLHNINICTFVFLQVDVLLYRDLQDAAAVRAQNSTGFAE